MDIIVPEANTNSQAREDDIVPRLQALLAEAIRQRTVALTLIDRHWYVQGDGDYCQACNLPENNGRHAERVAA